MKLNPAVTAVVTGAANGIGRATAVALASRGCTVVLVDIDDRGLTETTHHLLAVGRRVSAHVADVTSRSDMAALAREIAGQHSTLDILVNSAGVALSGLFDEVRLDDVEWLFGVNFWGVVYSCHAFLPLLQRARSAAVVNLLSPLAWVGAPGKTAYSAAKFAVRGFSESLASELAGSSVRVIRVYPGPVNTGIVRAGRSVHEDARQREAGLLAKCGLAPDAVAKAIVRAIEGRTAQVVVGFGTRLIDVASRMAPALTMHTVAHLTKRLAPFR